MSSAALQETTAISSEALWSGLAPAHMPTSTYVTLCDPEPYTTFTLVVISKHKDFTHVTDEVDGRATICIMMGCSHRSL